MIIWQKFPFFVLKLLDAFEGLSDDVFIVARVVVVKPEVVKVAKECEDWFHDVSGGWNLVEKTDEFGVYCA